MSGPATRSALLRLRRRRARVDRGAALLRRKREALAAELFRAARPALEARGRIEEAAREATALLHGALALRGESQLEADGAPPRPIEVTLTEEVLWGVPAVGVEGIPPLRRSAGGREAEPGSLGPAAQEAAGSWEHLVELLLEAAPQEALVRRLGEQLARTSRQVHVLEQRLAPALGAEASRVERTLDQREREEQDRLRRLVRNRR